MAVSGVCADVEWGMWSPTHTVPVLSAEERERREQLIKAWKEQKTAIKNQGQPVWVSWYVCPGVWMYFSMGV